MEHTYRYFYKCEEERGVKTSILKTSDEQSFRFSHRGLSFVFSNRLNFFLGLPDTTGLTQLSEQISQSLYSHYQKLEKKLFTNEGTGKILMGIFMAILVLKKVHRVIKFNQNVWVKPYIDMNTGLRKKAKNYFVKDFFKLINNATFGKTMENVTKHRDIKLATTERRRNYLVSEPNYQITKCFTENLSAIEMKKE